MCTLYETWNNQKIVHAGECHGMWYHTVQRIQTLNANGHNFSSVTWHRLYEKDCFDSLICFRFFVSVNNSSRFSRDDSNSELKLSRFSRFVGRCNITCKFHREIASYTVARIYLARSVSIIMNAYFTENSSFYL